MQKTSRSPLLLAGDIGGTKARLGIFQASGDDVRMVRAEELSSARYSGPAPMIRTFLRPRERISAASFGIAGPVINGTAIATNLPWMLSENSLSRSLNIRKLSLINDLVANAYGIALMKKGDFASLNRARQTEGNKALLSAGTGLGAAILFWDGRRHIVSPSEGGHVEFGPKNRLELGLLRYLFERFGHVSYERILSGAGLFNIYQFLRDTGVCGSEPRWLSLRIDEGDPAAVITETARLGKNRLCQAALHLFVSIYGAAAGNLALQVMANGGMYLGGGIAPKIIWKLRDGTFMKAFSDKGRLSQIVGRIPVKVIMNDRAALWGAAAHASEMLKKR
ncbi:MAG: glucokinase [Nitrospirota bacterium]